MSGGRLCPRCSTLIESSSAVFCYNCGQEMLTSEVVSAPIVDDFLAGKESSLSKRSFPFKFLLIIFTFLFGFGLLIFFLLSHFKNDGRSQNILRPSANDFVSTVSALPQASIAFGKEAYTSLAPVTAELYLEGGSLKNFLARFLDGSSQKRLESSLGLSLEETISFFDPSFAFIKSASGSALFTQSRDREFVNSRMVKLQKDGGLQNLQVDLLGDVLVVTDSLSLLKDIRQASQKSQLSLSMTGQFLETLKKLPREGQLLIYSSNLDDVLLTLRIFFGPSLENALDSLRGTSFVISSRLGSVLIIGIHD